MMPPVGWVSLRSTHHALSVGLAALDPPYFGQLHGYR
jgi:hypothetical protein